MYLTGYQELKYLLEELAEVLHHKVKVMARIIDIQDPWKQCDDDTLCDAHIRSPVAGNCTVFPRIECLQNLVPIFSYRKVSKEMLVPA
jgi:hypothetical protein